MGSINQHLKPATTVTDETTPGIAPAVGTSRDYARADHTHGTEAGGGGLPLTTIGDMLFYDGVVGIPIRHNFGGDAVHYASTTNPSYPLVNLTDANDATRWAQWGTPLTVAWLKADLLSPKYVSRFRLFQYANASYAALTYLIEYSTDDVNWITLETHTRTAFDETFDFAPIEARYWRITPITGGGSNWNVWEWEILGPAVPPNPGNERLPIGSNGQVLTVVNLKPAWQAPADQIAAHVAEADPHPGYQLESTLGVYNNWTPTVTQSVAVAVTVNEAKYTLIGKMLHAYAKLTVNVGAAGVAGNAIYVGVPTNPAVPVGGPVGTCLITDSGTAGHAGITCVGGATSFIFRKGDTNNYLGISPSFALAPGDIIELNVTYRVA